MNVLSVAREVRESGSDRRVCGVNPQTSPDKESSPVNAAVVPLSKAVMLHELLSLYANYKLPVSKLI